MHVQCKGLLFFFPQIFSIKDWLIRLMQNAWMQGLATEVPESSSM